MATPQLSPGVLVREVDLTVGRADNVLDNIGAIAGPFPTGPVDEAMDIPTERDLINVFGKPLSLDGQYEYWMSASSYLSYGGVLKVVRTDGDTLRNANVRRIRSGEIIEVDNVSVASTLRTPGTYLAQNTGLTTAYVGPDGEGAIFSITVADNGAGLGSTVSVSILNGGNGWDIDSTITVSSSLVGVGTTSTLGVNVTFDVADIYTTGGVSVVGDPTLKIKNFDDYSLNYADDIASYMFTAKNPGSWSNKLKVCIIDDKADQIIGIGTQAVATLIARQDNGIGLGVTVSLNNVTFTQPTGINSTFTGYLKGIITGVQDDAIDVKIVGRVAIGTDVAAPITYKARDRASSIRPSTATQPTIVNIISDGASPGIATVTLPVGGTFVKDWYDNQFLDLEYADVLWRSIAPKPITNRYSLDRNGRNDAIHVVIVDDTGEVTGIQGNLLEKHLNLSKSIDAISAVNPQLRIWYKEYLAQYSSYIYAGDNPSDNQNNEQVYQTGFSEGFSPYTVAEGLWNEIAQDKTFSAIGNAVYVLSGGVDYNDLEPGATGSMTAELGYLLNSYDVFINKDEIEVDYLIMGPGLSDKYESQAKAGHLISLCEQRKDCMAVLSPHRADVVSEPEVGTGLRQYLTTDQITDNIIEFFSPLPSSSYAVFDSGYKYTYDRFNNKFRYIPCNGDVAGLMVRTSIQAYPWFSPAGQQRGIINNAIKLAYSPNKAQRDQLYPQRVNSIVTQPGIGTLLFGDKTALGYASAFDRINVRRLFLTVEQALQRSAQAQLFELNDEITRANFRNIVEPYLRDVQAKRGLYGFLVVCDASNNTPDVIDNNEFRADIYLKPAKSINYITLTFVAVRTGVSFEEVAGTV
jgi:hypothetical protein